jgi:hypothetical protein
MLYLALALFFLSSFIVLSQRWALWKRIAAVVLIGMAAVGICFAVPQNQYLGADEEQSWTVDAGLFAILLLGMGAKYLWDLIEERQKKNSSLPPGSPKCGLAFDFWDFVKPLLVSVVVFEAVAGIQHSLSRVALVGSFQNGFFWQTVFQKRKP